MEHLKTRIANFEGKLDEKVERLLQAIRGRALSERYPSPEGQDPADYRFVSETDVRLAADEFQALLREIKRVLK